ncbi:MAG TPA: SpoIIE family protein phosphatase, partial [Spirochaetota bacterium]|nr:SpoIIE family protein phosphatase [Spirochaetota bacterium]HRX49608.1 SpoIIE family protein phosphatase [Spirochaetota bacterium]
MDKGLNSIISSRFGIFYAVTDISLKVKFPDSRLKDYLACSECTENTPRVSDIFPEVIGIEDQILDVINGSRDSLTIKRINRATTDDIFFNLHFFSDTGDSGYSYIVVEDITESSISFREAQQVRNEVAIKNFELVKREEFVSTILETIPAPIFYRDSSGRCLGCNRAFEEFAAKNKDEIIGRDISLILKESNELLRFDNELKKNGGIRRYESGIADGYGNERHLIINKSLFFGADQQSSVIVSAIVDITERKRMEEQLKFTMNELELSEKNLSEKIRIMESNMLIARRAVDTLIQKEFPESEKLEIDCRYLPLEQIGGDFYSIIPFDDFMGVFVCDITGHGVASALFLSLMKYFTDKIKPDLWRTPSEYLSLINREYFRGNSMFYFFSAIAGAIFYNNESDFMEFRFANGGHPHPVVLKKNGVCFFPGGNDSVIGLFDEQKFKEYRISIERGDMLFLYTDGIPSTYKEDGSIIGFDESLLEIFRKSRRETLRETINAVINEVEFNRGEKKQEDDILLLGFYC